MISDVAKRQDAGDAAFFLLSFSPYLFLLLMKQLLIMRRISIENRSQWAGTASLPCGVLVVFICRGAQGRVHRHDYLQPAAISLERSRCRSAPSQSFSVVAPSNDRYFTGLLFGKPCCPPLLSNSCRGANVSNSLSDGSPGIRLE